MQADTRDGYLDRALRAGDPLALRKSPSEALDEALDGLGAAIVMRSKRDRSRGTPWSWAPRRRGALLAAAAVLCLGAGAAAATKLFIPTHTGVYPNSRADIRMGGPGEDLNASGTDFRQVALAAASDIPYPRGYASWRNWVIGLYAHPPQRCAHGTGGKTCGVFISTGALRGWFAMSAFCAWVRDWHQAMVTGDRFRAAYDARVVAGAPGWRAVRAESQDPQLFAWMRPYARSLLAGDLRRVDRLLSNPLYSNRFMTYDPGAFRWVEGSRGSPTYLQYLTRVGS